MCNPEVRCVTKVWPISMTHEPQRKREAIIKDHSIHNIIQINYCQCSWIFVANKKSSFKFSLIFQKTLDFKCILHFTQVLMKLEISIFLQE